MNTYVWQLITAANIYAAGEICIRERIPSPAFSHVFFIYLSCLFIFKRPVFFIASISPAGGALSGKTRDPDLAIEKRFSETSEKREKLKPLTWTSRIKNEKRHLHIDDMCAIRPTFCRRGHDSLKDSRTVRFSRYDETLREMRSERAVVLRLKMPGQPVSIKRKRRNVATANL